MTLVFLDTETTGLADECDVWEIGLIHRKPGDPTEYGLAEDVAVTVDIEYSWRLCPDMATAEPTGLRIGRYYQRIGPVLSSYGPGHGHLSTPDAHVDDRSIREAKFIAADLARLLDGAIIVGAVPNFDAQHLSRWLRQHNHVGTWHYHLVDVETLAAGALKMAPPWDFKAVLDAYGLAYKDEADRHTALGDARMVRDLYDAVMT